MGKSAKFYKRLSKKEKKVQSVISNNNKLLTSESESQSSKLSSQESLNSAKASATTKITKKQNKRKRVKAVTIDGSKKDDGKDYVDIFTGKKLYKPLIGKGN
ncbi:hypothetical protein RclHR1_00090044 [Rhizophagus clarus]|uniref:Uncharacterized protein n=1 Tax=Rhizophagus clarus TaxID=94130 RepID=A0A2Z6SGJ7_9GLOM|nr:hypothetical protein RclHR1_00090044 [Rhizophagus clarus]GES90469.1 hypothetical protein RCL_jg13563.t1 [Rhizophagus clarus]